MQPIVHFKTIGNIVNATNPIYESFRENFQLKT